MGNNTRFVWNELVTSDQGACSDFYTSLLGWNRRDVDMGPLGTYTVFQQDGDDVAGMMSPATEYSKGRPSFWSAYISVDDIDACADRVAELGGKIIAPPEDIPDVGRVCMLTDPSGAPVCLMTPVKRA